MRKIRLLAKRNIQGYYMNLLLSRLWSNDSYSVEFTDCRDIYSAIQEHNVPIDTTELFIVGLPFWESQYSALAERLTTRGLLREPLQVFHYATFGDRFVGEPWQEDCLVWNSYVDEEISPVGMLTELLLDRSFTVNCPFSYDKFMLINKDIMRWVNAYNQYNFKAEEEESVLGLIELGNLFKEQLPMQVQPDWTAEDILQHYSGVVYGLTKTRETYISQALSRVTTTAIQGTAVSFLYAEQYPNEIAHTLIDFYKQHGYPKVVVFIGKHTKGDDLFSVRSYGVNAGELVKRLNNGKGKPNTATVFLGKSIESTQTALISTLSEIL